MPLDIHNWLLVFVRTGAFLTVVPFFSAINFPVRTRVALAALAALLVSPSLPLFPAQNLGWIALTVVLAKEVGVGLILGFVTRLIYYASDLAGSFISTEMGLSLSVSFNPMAGMQSQVPGTILFYLASLLLVSSDLHHWFLVAFQRSYDVLPIGAAQLRPGLLTDAVTLTGGIFHVALLVAAPLIAVSFVITLVFAVLSRAVPQMNVFSESFAVRTLGGLAVFGMTVHLMGQHLHNYLRRLPDDMLRVAQLLGS